MNFTCPHCSQVLRDDGAYAGQFVACPHCGGAMQMPGRSQPPAPPRMSASYDRNRSRHPQTTDVFAINKNMSSPRLSAKGVNGQIELHSNKVCICRKGVLGFLTQGLKGDKNIMISTITSIQFKKAGLLTNGYIQFAFMGGQEAKGGLFQGTQDENTVMFTAKQQPLFEQMKDSIESRIQAGNSPASTASDADELAKLADLRDKGILSEDEFQHKKRQILGL